MKSIALLILALCFLSYCSSNQKSTQELLNHIFNSKYEHSIISKGDNLPNFDRRKDSIALFLVALHEHIEPGKFQEKAKWTDEVLEERIQFLKDRGWLMEDDQGLRPTVFIASDHQGKLLFKHGLPLSEDIADAIEKEIPGIIEKFNSHGLSDLYGFENLSFLVLSNVLLDNWQIMEMEASYLKKENRPERHGKFYYASIEENVNNAYEPFGIYGNQYGKINNSTYLSIYGNNRIVVNQRLQNDQVFRDSVLNVALELTPDLYNFFDTIAQDFKPKLLKILDSRTAYSHNVYEITGYAGEIAFEEFFIWWYHFIYTQATNILAERGKLIIPDGGNFYYR
jgi:hypothetical protein